MRARCHGAPRRSPRRAGYARFSLARRPWLSLRILPGGPGLVGTGGLQPHRRGPWGAALPGDPRDARDGCPQPHDGEAARPTLDSREPPGGARVGSREEQAAGGGDRGATLAEARRPVLREEASCAPAGPHAGRGGTRRLPPQPIDAPTRRPPAFTAPPSPSTRPPAQVTPLSPDRYRVQVTIGGDTLEKLRLAKDLLRHALPSGDEAAILDRALTALLTDLAQRKFAATERPRLSSGTTPGSRHVPAEVKRAVWLRDLGRCAFLGTNGRRCPERGFLEFHHRHPYALGGPATAANIQLRCRAHNDLESRVDFGRHGRVQVREKAAVPYGAELVPERVRARGRSKATGPPME
jgi:hypothetical protein